MSNPTRIANKTQWALQDIAAASARARRACTILADRNEQKFMDPLLSIQVQRIADALNAIEVTAIRAQHGEYEQKHKRE
jgi:uncharacterized protein (UPF0305 family)